MARSYDPKIREHYDTVASQFGDSPQSTMADEIVRAKETALILRFVDEVAKARLSQSLVVADIGCGNGYTLKELSTRAPKHRYTGVEHNDSLRAIAAGRFNGEAKVIGGDIRDLSSIAIESGSLDVIVCQRVIINIMDEADQRTALANIAKLAKPGAGLIFLETFKNSLDRLNDARAEFGLSAIPPAIHNLPLPDDFFAVDGLSPFPAEGFDENIFSTHFFVSRVLHEIALKSMNTPFKRNSHFVRFMSEALPEGVGDYAPLRVKALIKR